MYLTNKYTRIYYQIIDKAREKTFEADVYTEKHHIIPKCLGGNNKKDNIVKLTAREHFLCHWLLTKMVKGKRENWQMYNAFSCMLYRNNDVQQRYKINSRLFEKLKINHSKLKSVYCRAENNGMYGKKHSAESKKKMSVAHTGKIISDLTREKLRLSPKHTGANLLMRGKNHPVHRLEVRQKNNMVCANPGKIPFTCEHCNKSGFGLGNLKRHHGDNCKYRIR